MRWAIYLMILVLPMEATVICHLRGQLGNQLFQMAAAIALAEENQCFIHVPEFYPPKPLHRIDKNYEVIFSKIPYQTPRAKTTAYYSEPGPRYSPIPYQFGIEIDGYFQSERYFRKHSALIRQLFSAPEFIEKDLQRDFEDLIKQPKTVAIHVRTYFEDFKNFGYNYKFYDAFLAPDLCYYQEAIEIFDEDSVFVVFSDDISWCRKAFSHIDREFIFVEGQDYLHDFYLMAKCKHVITGSSTFSWWGAYLNESPDKIVVCRRPFLFCDPAKDPGLICDGWIVIDRPEAPPYPVIR